MFGVFRGFSLGKWRQRVATTLADDGWASDMRVRNCTFYGGSLGIAHWDSGSFLFRDNLFDRTSMYQDGDVVSDYNGFGLGSTMFDPAGAHDLKTNLTFVAGPLGYYYQPTNSHFVQRDTSTTADEVGLYHFTVTTNLVNGWEIRETNSVLDLGYHYVAVNPATGQPLDTDDDGLADYLDDDADGDGMEDAWELANGLNPLSNDADDDPDGDWSTNLQEYEAGTNPNDTMVVAWGNNDAGQCSVPLNLRNVTALAGSSSHFDMRLVRGLGRRWRMRVGLHGSHRIVPLLSHNCNLYF